MNCNRSALATLVLAAAMTLAALPADAKNAGRNPPGRKPIPVSEPAPVNLNPLAAFWAHWAAYWGN